MKKVKKIKSISSLMKQAQKAFNTYIRNRDIERGCISCTGKVEQAGHYFSTGHYSSLRFSESNTHGQCIRCNMYLSGNLIKYRQGLIKRIGEEKVKQLELSASLRKYHKWNRVELESIIKTYK